MPDDVAHAFGKARLARLHRADPHAVDLHERAGLDEVAQHLGDEERIAVGLGREPLRELDAGFLERIPARGFEERAHPGLVEAVQRDALGAGGAVQIGERARQGMAPVDIGVAVRHEHEDVRVRIEVADDMSQQVHAARVGPVRVVEQHDDRLRHRAALEHVDDRVEQQQPFGVRIGRGGRRRVRCAASHLGDETGQLTPVVRDVFDDHVVGRRGHDRTEELGPRRVGCGDVLVAAAQHDERAFFVRLPRELRGQPGLADTRFTGQENGGGAVHLRALPRVGESKPLVVARRERQLAGLAPQRRGQRRRRADRRGPGHFERDDRVGKTLQLDLADEHEAELGVAAGESAHEIVAEDLAPVGGVAQSGGGDDRRAVTVAVLPRDVTRADPDAHLEAAVVAPLPVGAVDPSLDLVGGVDGLGGRTERREDAVAEPLDHRPALLGDRGAEDLVVAAPNEIGLDVAEARPHLGATDDVGVQNRRCPRPVEHRKRLRGPGRRPGGP